MFNDYVHHENSVERLLRSSELNATDPALICHLRSVEPTSNCLCSGAALLPLLTSLATMGCYSAHCHLVAGCAFRKLLVAT